MSYHSDMRRLKGWYVRLLRKENPEHVVCDYRVALAGYQSLPGHLVHIALAAKGAKVTGGEPSDMLMSRAFIAAAHECGIITFTHAN